MVRVTWNLLASILCTLSVHSMVLLSIDSKPLSQVTEQSFWLRNSLSSMAMSDMRQTRKSTSNDTAIKLRRKMNASINMQVAAANNCCYRFSMQQVLLNLCGQSSKDSVGW